MPLNEPGDAPSTPESFAKIYLPTSLLSLPLGVSVAVSGQLPTASSTSLNTPTSQQWYPRQTGLVETVRKWVREDVDPWVNQAIIPHHTSQGNSLEECGAVVDARTTQHYSYARHTGVDLCHHLSLFVRGSTNHEDYYILWFVSGVTSAFKKWVLELF
jgi:hypothetical protein